MVLKKKKVKKTKGVKLGKTSIKSAKARKREQEERKAGRSQASFVKFPANPRGKILWIIPPTSDAMNGYPTVDKLSHNNLGPEEKGWGPCVAKNMSREEREKCRACRYVAKLWDKSREAKKSGDLEKEEKYKKSATSKGVKNKPLAQVLDVTGVFKKIKGKPEKPLRQFPKCFGENYKSEEQKYDKCETCPFQSSCKEGVQKWEMQFGAAEKLTEQLGEEEIDVTDPAAAVPLKIVRKGEGQFKTRYTEEWLEPIVIPPHVIKFVERHAVDLTKAVAPSTPEQMDAMMDGTKKDKDSDESPVKKKKKLKSGKIENIEKPTVTKEQREKLRARLKADSKKKLKKK